MLYTRNSVEAFLNERTVSKAQLKLCFTEGFESQFQDLNWLNIFGLRFS